MAYRKPTGAMLKALRPETYRMVVELLSEPREHVSYHEIERVCGLVETQLKRSSEPRPPPLRNAKRAFCRSPSASLNVPSIELKAVSTTLLSVSLCPSTASQSTNPCSLAAKPNRPAGSPCQPR